MKTFEDMPVLLDGLAEFQEHLGGILTVSMLESIGHSREIHAFDLKILKKCIGDVLLPYGQPA